MPDDKSEAASIGPFGRGHRLQMSRRPNPLLGAAKGEPVPTGAANGR